MSNSNEQSYSWATSPNSINHMHSPSFDSFSSTNTSSSFDYSGYYGYSSSNSSFYSYSPYSSEYSPSFQAYPNAYSPSYSYNNLDNNLYYTPSTYIYQTNNYPNIMPTSQHVTSTGSSMVGNLSVEIDHGIEKKVFYKNPSKLFLIKFHSICLFLKIKVQDLTPKLRRQQDNKTCSLNEKLLSRKHQLPDEALDILNEWYEDHLHNPYPLIEEKEMLARRGNITVKQVSAWFSNRRNRTQNTKPKRMKRVLEKEMTNMFNELAQSTGKQALIEKFKDALSKSVV
jgi:hypothetical protein